MSNLFTYRLGMGALLATSLVSLAAVCFIIFEQTSQIKALQKTLHSVCLRTVADQLQDTESRSEDIMHEKQHHLASLLKGAVICGHFQVWLIPTQS